MSKYKRPWKTLEDLKQEEWELQIKLFGAQAAFKDYLANVTPAIKNNANATGYIIHIADEVNRYGTLIKRLNRELEDVREEIKEREDEENKITADNL